MEGTWFYLYLVGLLGELREILEAALTAARALRDERREGRLLRRYGVIFWVQGEYEKALEKGLKAEEIALRYNDERELGRVSHTLTDILSRRGALREAEQRAQEMLERGERFTYLKLKALAIYRLSELQARKHEFEQALECLDRGEQWCKELGWSRGLAWTIYLRGITLIQQGESAAAEPYLLQSLRMATSWNERHLMANNQYGLARVSADTGRVRRAHQMADKACDLYDRLGAATKVAEVEVLLHNLPEKND